MAVFSLFGRAEKRVVAYPLIRACSIDGRTLVVTDDGNFKNLFEDEGDRGACGHADIIVSPGLSAEGVRRERYLHMVCVSADGVCGHADCRMEFVNNSTAFLAGRPYFEEEELGEHDGRVLLSTDFKKAAGGRKAGRKIGIPLEVTGERLLYCAACEEARELLPVSDKAVAGVVASLAAGFLSMKEAEVVRLLRRPFYQGSEREGGRR